MVDQPETTPILADLVGISSGKAAAWAKLAARDWSDYVANRVAGGAIEADSYRRGFTAIDL